MLINQYVAVDDFKLNQYIEQRFAHIACCSDDGSIGGVADFGDF